MKAFFRSKNFIVLAAVTCVLVAVIIYSACTGGGAISNIFGAVISPMQSNCRGYKQRTSKSF